MAEECPIPPTTASPATAGSRPVFPTRACPSLITKPRHISGPIISFRSEIVFTHLILRNNLAKDIFMRQLRAGNCEN